MKTRVVGHYTQYKTDQGDLLIGLERGRIQHTGDVPRTTLAEIEAYAKQLLEAVEAAKLVVNMNEKG